MTNIYNEFSITTKDGLDLYGQGWFPESGITKNIVFIHGIGEHGTRYAHWAKKFNDKRMGFFIMDLRGHGKSDGKRGHVSNLSFFLDDIDLLVKYVKDSFPMVPIVLYGHSMGGNILINYLLKRSQDFQGAIAGSPWTKLPYKIPALKMGLAKFANSLFPSLVQASGLNVENLSRDKKVVEDYKNDPLNHDKVSARMFMELYSSGMLMSSQSKNIKLPMLVIHGTKDELTSPKASEEFVENANDNVKLKLWKDFYHELHNEPEKQEVFDYVIEWIQGI